MRIRTVLKAAALGAVIIASPVLARDYDQPELPRHQVPLIEYDNQLNDGPMLVWPRGLYDNINACLKARTALIGPTGQHVNEGAPYAVMCCLGAGGNRCQTAPLNVIP